MDNHRPPHDVGGGSIAKCDSGTHDGDQGLPVLVGLKVAQIAGMGGLSFGACMGNIGRIEMPAGGLAVGRGTVADLMNMKTMVAGSQSFDIGFHPDTTGSDRERHDSRDATFSQRLHDGFHKTHAHGLIRLWR